MRINQRDLMKLAILLSKVVHSIDTPESGKLEKYCLLLLRLIDHLERKYSKLGLLRSLRDAVSALPEETTSFYIVSRDVIRMANKPFDFEQEAIRIKEDKPAF